MELSIYNKFVLLDITAHMNHVAKALSRSEASFAAAACHPMPLVVALVMALNDHVFKFSGSLPPWFTGKLSDFAGLFIFPILVAATIRGAAVLFGGSHSRLGRRFHLAVVATTAIGFILVNTSSLANGAIGSFWMDKVMDTTDLLALVALVPAFQWMERAHGS